MKQYGSGKLAEPLEKNIVAGISYDANSKRFFKASLKQWLSKTIQFDEINYATFSKDMVLAVVEFDKDNCIYVLLPKTVFNTDTPDYYAKKLK